MTATYITCDSAGCQASIERDDAEEALGLNPSVSDVRGYAVSKGWVVKRFDKWTADLCPQHANDTETLLALTANEPFVSSPE